MMLEDAAEPASRAPIARPIATGRGWAINDVVCRLGPQDRSGEERFHSATIAVVRDGLFECRSSAGTALLYPGAFFLGNAGTCFECGHDYGVGDRCVAFHFDAALFEEIAATAAGSHRFRFPIAMLPSSANLAPSAVEALLHASGESLAEADETAILTADIVIRTVSGLADAPPSPMPRERSRLIRAIDYLEEHGDEAISLDDLCVVACMSKYHFLRCFRALTGMTPHQYLIALRLRRAATALWTTSESVAAIAFEVGFGDLSTFNARFRTAFGASPQRFRRRQWSFSAVPSARRSSNFPQAAGCTIPASHDPERWHGELHFRPDFGPACRCPGFRLRGTTRTSMASSSATGTPTSSPTRPAAARMSG